MNHVKDNEFGDQLIDLLPRLRRFAYTLTSCREDADDLVQAACERALSRQHQWHVGTRLDSWIFRIIYTLRVDQTRSARSRIPHLLFEEEHCQPMENNGETKMESKLMLQQVLATMRQLSDNDRTLLALVCIEGFSYKETASVLDIPIGTVMSRLARARHRLYDQVHEQPVH